MPKRNLTFLIAFGLTSCLGAFAQTTDSQPAPAVQQVRPQPNPDRQAHNLTKKLGLSSDQENQLKPILEDRQQQMQAIRADTTLAPKDRAAKVRSVRQDSEAKINSLLNDDQKQKYAALKQEMHQRHQEQKQGGTAN